MRPRIANHSDQQGFTLIEVIVAIILAALLGAMIIQYTGSNLRATVESLVAVHNNTTAVRTMEQITRDYRNWLENNPGQPLSDFQTNILTPGYPQADAQFITLRPGADPPNSILRVTVSEGDRKLVSLFTR